jgi:hypothetical protein
MKADGLGPLLIQRIATDAAKIVDRSGGGVHHYHMPLSQGTKQNTAGVRFCASNCAHVIVGCDSLL